MSMNEMFLIEMGPDNFKMYYDMHEVETAIILAKANGKCFRVFEAHLVNLKITEKEAFTDEGEKADSGIHGNQEERIAASVVS